MNVLLNRCVEEKSYNIAHYLVWHLILIEKQNNINLDITNELTGVRINFEFSYQLLIDFNQI